MGVRVLLIEDDETIAEPLADGLRHFGLTVHHVATGTDGLRGPHGDVVLLDLGLPDMDGIDVCRGIRRTSDVPIIILSARGEEADRVLGLELGADDYLAKPFSIRELVARIRAVSRRHKRPGGGATGGGAGGTMGREVVAGVVVAEAGIGRPAGPEEPAGVGPGTGLGLGLGRGAGPGGAAEFESMAGSSTYGSWSAPAPEPGAHGESAADGESAAGDGYGGRRRAGSRFGADNDFASVGDTEADTPYRAGVGGTGGTEGTAAVGAPGGAGETGGVGAGGADGIRGAGGVGGTGGFGGAGGVGEGGGAQYDWSAPYETPAHGTPTYADRTQNAPTVGSPARGASALGGPAYRTPAYGSPVHEPPAYEPPVVAPYEPPMYEQAPPAPRAPSGGAAADVGAAPPPGPLVVDRRTRQVWVGEVPVALTPKEFELLALLTEDPGAVYSRQQILNRVWDDHYQGPTKTLDVHVATLRRKLGDPAWIQTLRGVGFRLAVRAPGPGQANGGGRGPGTRSATESRAGTGRHRTPEARAS
ncbi:winged-helix domain-containing protein [Streptomyces sp. AC495_CC817]|uniref:winged helix-turn-helix transcriptional regulator n=2 Tax=unclassified Streptomyces TaxID=2593676 RepID=UPI001C273FC6